MLTGAVYKYRGFCSKKNNIKVGVCSVHAPLLKWSQKHSQTGGGTSTV